MLKVLLQYARSSLAFALQSLTLIYSYVVGLTMMRLRVEKFDDLMVAPGTLIIANHQSKSDPFLIIAYMGIRNVVKNLPARFPVVHTFMKRPVVGKLLWGLHCFEVGATHIERAYALVKIRDFLKKKKTVVLFPEGRRIKVGNEVEDFNKGIDMLLKNDYPIVLARIYHFNDWKIIGNSNQPIIRYKSLPTGLTLEQKHAHISRFYS